LARLNKSPASRRASCISNTEIESETYPLCNRLLVNRSVRHVTNPAGRQSMKRTLVIVSLLCISVTHAQADHVVYTYHDTIRPHGHKRPDAVGEANIRLCDERPGIHQGATPAYKKCMRELGYRYVSRHLVRTPEPLQESPDDDSSPPPADIDIPSSPPPPSIDMTPPPQVDPGPSPDIHPFCADTIC
jgi:hypothetical protein